MGLCESDYSDSYFDSDAHYGNSAHLAFVCWAFSFDPCHQDPITLIAFRFPNWVPNSPYCRFGLQRPTKLLLEEFYKDARAPHTNFFQLWWKLCFLGSSWLSLKWHYWFYVYIHINIPIILSIWISFPTLNQGRAGISSFGLHVSSNQPNC